MRLSLRGKYEVLLFLVIAVVAILLSIAATATYKKSISSLRGSINADVSKSLTEQMVMRAHGLTDILIEELTNALYHYDLSSIEKNLKSVKSGPDILETLVVDDTCRIIHDGTSDIIRYSQPIDTNLCDRSMKADGQFFISDEDSVTSIKQFWFNDKVVGLLLVKLSLEDTKTRISGLAEQFEARERTGIKHYIYSIVSVTLLLGLISLLLSRVLASKLIRPIDTLRHHIREISRGNYENPVRAKRGDELEDLIDAFEQMRLSLSKSTVSIEKLQKEIAEKEEAELQKKKIEHRLLQAEKMEGIGQLAAGVAHDLNNILSGIVSLPELILMQIPDDSPMRRHIETIEKSGIHAAMIVQDMLTLSKGGLNTEDVVSLQDVLSEYMESPERRRLKDTHPGVQLTLYQDSDVKNIKGSAVHLLKLIMNLVNNSADAIEGKGEIGIQLRNLELTNEEGLENLDSGEYVYLKVTDTGAGIAREDLDKIFEPFYSNKSLGRKSTGLGMLIIWNTVKDHNGAIFVDSEIGESTTIRVYFPSTSEIVHTQFSRSESILAAGDGEHIMVVDDTDSQREIAKAILESLNYSVTTVSSGEEAVETYRGGGIDLILLDMIMEPGINGLETTKRLLAEHPAALIVIASGYSESGMVSESISLGARQFIQKPYSVNSLGTKIKEVLSV